MSSRDHGGQPDFVVDIAGIARGNPGLCGVGLLMTDGRGRTLEHSAHYLGLATPMQAEYRALICGLEALQKRRQGRAVIRTSSDVLWRQVTGKTGAHAPEIMDLFVRVQQLLSGEMQPDIQLVDPASLSVAERLANVAIDSRGRRQAID